MPDLHELRQALREWVQRAENGLTAGVATLRLARKAPLILRNVRCHRTHDLSLVASLSSEALRPELREADLKRWTAYAALNRYPGNFPSPMPAEAREATRIACRVRAWRRKLLPRLVLSKE